MTRRPTIAVALHDGWYGCGTGAGYANFAFLETLVQLLAPGTRLVILPLLLHPSSHQHHPDWHARAEALVSAADTTILPVDNGTDGIDRWGTVENFQRLSAHAADRIELEVLPQAGPLLIVAFDVPFFGLPALLSRRARARTVVVPRSTGLIHTPLDRRRIRWETEELHAGLADGTRVGAISPFMARHLHADYRVPRSAMLPVPDGLAHSEWARSDRQHELLRGSVFPAEFLLSMGRAEPYKGFDDLLDALEILQDTGTEIPHLILAATSESPLPSSYQQHLMTSLRQLDLTHTILTRFTPAVPSLLGHPGLRGVVVPSRAEPFGRIPMEAFAAGAAPVISTTAGGLAHQVIDGSTGISCPPGSPPHLAEALRRALEMDHTSRSHLRRGAHQHALRNFDQVDTVRHFLTETASWLRLPDTDDQLRWLSTTAPPVRAGSPVSIVSPVKVPISLQAQHWNTIEPERLVLVVAHHITSLLRLLDVITVFDSDPRIQVVFSWNGSDPFQHGIHRFLQDLGTVIIPWHQAIDTEFDLVIAANHGGLTEITAPLVIIPHGAGYNKNSPGNRKPETGNRKPETGNRSVFGLSPEWLLYNGRPIATSLVLSHEEQLARLESTTPAAASSAVVAGDPCFDRMLRSSHLRDQYRGRLGVAPGQKLVTISSTWWRRSLMGTWPSLFREVLACLPSDDYRVAAVIHPNVWHGHGPWQVHTWLADCVRAGLLVVPPEEGWQAMLIASDLVLGDHGATTCYAAGLLRPVLLASFPDEDVAAGSAADLLGRTAPRLHRHVSLRDQITTALDQDVEAYRIVRDAVTSCPGESAARLRTLFYRHLDLAEPNSAALVPVVPAEAMVVAPRPEHTADRVVCSFDSTATAHLVRYPAEVTPGRSAAAEIDDTFLVAHEDHPQRALLDSADVVLIGPSENPDRTTAVLDDTLQRFPGAALAVVTGKACVVHVRDAGQVVLDTADPVVAGSLIYAWLLAQRALSELPAVTSVIAGPHRLTIRITSTLAQPVPE
ncbi:glycosyltransferase family 4 protein [Amycolatopsis sp. lyj-112]|uniref:glycosyltransferase family 4 protein n=1 Tax=Amycolatopsis sp. lyj-112 TaxID=2789288 RepID=UPI0039795561